MSEANKLTTEIIKELNYGGFVVWRQNNVGKVAGRFISNKSGIPDIIGYEKKTGRFIGVEIKIGKDKLSDEQKTFLIDLKNNGGYAIVASSFEQFETEFNLYKAKFKLENGKN